jgi:hypothetical protein
MTFWLGPFGMRLVSPQRVSRSMRMSTADAKPSASAGHGSHRDNTAAPMVSTWYATYAHAYVRGVSNS